MSPDARAKRRAAALVGAVAAVTLHCGARDALLLDEEPEVEPTTAASSTASASSSGAGGCSPDLETDPDHCGRCGYDCMGGACREGMCQPFVLWSGLDNPVGLAADDDALYVTASAQAGDVWRVAKDGASATSLASQQPFPFDVVVDDAAVFWTNVEGDLMRVDKTGSAPVVLGGAAGQPYALAIDQTTVWWGTVNPGALFSVAKAGGLSTFHYSNPSGVHAVLVDDARVYFMTTSDGILWSMPIAGGQASYVVSQAPIFGWMAADATRIFGAGGIDGTTIASTPKSGAATVTVLVEGRGAVGPLALDETHVYFGLIGEDGGVATVPKSGGQATTLASGTDAPARLVVDGEAIYFTAPESGAVMKLRKP